MEEYGEERTDERSSAESSSEQAPLAYKETVAVNRSKMLVIVVFFLAAATVSAFAYILSHNEEKGQFESDVERFASEIIEVAEEHTRSLLQVARSVSTSFTAHSVSSNYAWPNMTLPLFETRAREAREQSGARLVAFAPLVSEKNRQGWQSYSVENQGWIEEGLDQQGLGDVSPEMVSPIIFPLPNRQETGEKGFFAPLWQMGAAPTDTAMVNADLLSHASFNRLVAQVLERRSPAISEITDLRFLYEHSASGEEEEDDEDSDEDRLVEGEEGDEQGENKGEPHAFILYPTFESLDEDAQVIGVVILVFPFSLIFKNDELIQNMFTVLNDSCGSISQHTYYIEDDVTYIGPEDFHEKSFNYLGVHAELELSLTEEEEESERRLDQDNEEKSNCEYTFTVYPSAAIADTYSTNQPVIYAVIVACIFACTSLMFISYDLMVQRRQTKVMRTATDANAIVSSFFPKNIHIRMMKNAAEQAKQREKLKLGGNRAPKTELKNFLEKSPDQHTATLALNPYRMKPIADLFMETTIMFADISGFTAWSSVRDPSQVFTLLETTFHAFDVLAKRHGVFKVETVGDCYVAVTGLPEPRSDHAVAMARYARDCLKSFSQISKELERHLGPDTGDLSMRFGIHSGPVTAGVLRGERQRFQLFGDTMNTAARMESSGEAGHIQVSKETAELLIGAGNESWVTPRESSVAAKGKGDMQTFWLRNVDDSSHVGAEAGTPINQEADVPNSNDDRVKRLIDWNVDILVGLLKEVAASRGATTTRSITNSNLGYTTPEGATVLDEVVEIIALPKFNNSREKRKIDLADVNLGPKVEEEIRDYLTVITMLYRKNPFHNFEHASHIAMSVAKLLGRIVAPDIEVNRKSEASTLHDHTYGITSDPLTQFSCIYSALIHDVDHTGVPNTVLANENTTLADRYRGKSIAEQHSVDLAWNLLMKDEYSNFRGAIYTNREELKRFRQLVVNSVMATDIMDKDLKELRNDRWDKAFSDKFEEDSRDSVNRKATIVIGLGLGQFLVFVHYFFSSSLSLVRLLLSNKKCVIIVTEDLKELRHDRWDKTFSDEFKEDSRDSVNRKATIVIEHLIQASDVAHTMQHWHVYRKWNERLFRELYLAHKAGRSDFNPAGGWYKGELGFFDFYIIPLAKKLADCGVFGVSSHEYLNYAQKNRQEWEEKGQEVVAKMVERLKDA